MKAKSWASESGQGLTEYAVVLSLVALLAIAGVSMLGSGLRGKISQLTGAIVGDSEVVNSANTRMSGLINKAREEAGSGTKGMSAPDQQDVIGNVEE